MLEGLYYAKFAEDRLATTANGNDLDSKQRTSESVVASPDHAPKCACTDDLVDAVVGRQH